MAESSIASAFQDSIGNNLSIKIDMGLASQSTNTIVPTLTEKESELNMQGLGSSSDEFEGSSAGPGPHSGCTGEPQ